MGKIPVGRTIEESYGFVFRRFPALLGVAWFPLLLIGVAVAFVVPDYVAAFQLVLLEDDPTALLGIMPFVFVVGIASFLLFTMILIGITRVALGMTDGPVYFYFSLGYSVWRLLWALICAYFLMFILFLGAGAVLGLIAGGAVFAAGEIAGVLVAGMGGFFLFFFVIYVLFRVMFFIVPVTVAEGHKVVRRSWALSRGNFWRGFVVMLAIVVPVMIVQMVIEAIAMSFVLSGIPFLPPGQELSPEETMALGNQVLGQLMQIAPYLFPAMAVLFVIMYGLLAAANAFAYRAIVPMESTEDVFA